MATTTTYSLEKPTVGGSENTWGGDWNDNADKIDDLLDGTLAIKPNLDEGLWEVGGVAVTATAAELNILDGVTASTAEINILDGVTASTAEINILDGVTASTAELNYVDGVTSAIQTQLDGKQASLGFTPVQQGGGTNQGTNKVYIGWNTSGTGLQAQVDSTDLGVIHTSSLGAGAVGTYALLKQTLSNTETVVGGTRAGSNLTYTNAEASDTSGTPSGTWRCMGYLPPFQASAPESVTVWLRIS